MKKLFVVGVKAAIRNDEGKLLVLERIRHNSPYWDLPGGSIENGETAYSTLIREIEAELPDTRNIKIGSLINTFDTGINIADVANLLFMIYEVEATLRSPIRLSGEHSFYKWIDTDLSSMDSLQMECGLAVGMKPHHLNWDQWVAVACRCVRPKGHNGSHQCGDEHGD